MQASRISGLSSLLLQTVKRIEADIAVMQG
jgi:hypothetical protein